MPDITLPKQVTLFEVGPRDGLQNEKAQISTQTKINLVDQLSQAGLRKIEAGSFVSAKWVPQMADSAEVFNGIERNSAVGYAALTPNLRGLEAALEAGADEVAIFASASEGFSQKNINCSIAESLERFKPVVARANDENLPVRGYVSCISDCPYDGPTRPQQVAEVASQLHDLGCYEISLGDTIGTATPTKIAQVLTAVSIDVPIAKLAIHCHDTYGQAIANIYEALRHGVATVDSSIAGLGGCPYAKGASGNVATEDVLYLLEGLGIGSGVDLRQIIAIGNSISQQLGRENQSKVARALSE